MAWEKNHKVRMEADPTVHDPVISIGTAAKKAGLSVSALRKYESEGLLLFHRTPSGRRMLSQADIKRVEVIQHLINKRGLNIEGIRRLLSLLPCWKMKPCTAAQREHCAAYLDSIEPCWMVHDSVCRDTGSLCHECTVYRYGAYFTDDIKTLLHTGE